MTHSPYNAAYDIPNPVPDPAVLQNRDGKVKVTVTNLGAEDWQPASYYLAYRAYNAETHPQKKRVKAAMLAGALFNRATDVFTKIVEIHPPHIAGRHRWARL